MNPLAAYIPQDRCHALACGTPLPDRTRGAALFADISGFTPLTEALSLALGPRHGSEALTDQINTTYDALIAQVDAFHGSVIGFAGDAITCWFDDADGPAARRAVACAVGMQRAMAVFAQIVLPGDIHSSLALKVAVAYGPARRMVAGDPAIQMLDLLAGATVARVATAEHHTVAGEIVLDAACVVELGAAVSIGAWREDAETGEQFAPLHDLTDIPPTSPWSELSADALTPEVLRPWLLPAAYARERAGYGAFLTELRPAVALFLRFSGIDYDTDPNAHLRLDTFIRSVQSVLARFGGALLQVIIGDKGSYLCCAFGAPVAHEDDARRAVLAALALPHEAASAATLPPLQIGISQGVMRCGAYGSPRRRTYGILGDHVNLAARLMSVAAPGETIVCGGVRAAVAARMTLEPRPPVELKGTAEPLPIFAVSGLRHERAVRLPEPTYALPMVGRTDEIATISHVLDHVLGGRGSVLGITAEAGLGKSRLVAELVRLAHQRGMIGYGGAGHAMDTRSPYVVWQPIWRAIFDLDPVAPLRRQLRALEGLVEDWAPERVAATPLLGPLLGIALPENDFTHSLAPKDRQSALHALLRDCLGAVAHEAHANGGGLLLILEDSHWLDAASIALLGELTQGIAELPVLVVLAYRPPDPPQPAVLPHAELPNFIQLSLEGLTPPAAAQLIRAKLLQLFPARSGAVPLALVTQLMVRTQGNPFYLEEVLSYLHDRGIDPREEGALDALALPDSLHRLILSRLDQLSAQQQVILKASSVIGRRFLVAWLRGAFPTLAPPEGLADDLAHLSELELTPLDTPEPELAYLFKHIVTREVAYESLGSATRATLHGQLAAYLEQVAGIDVAGLLDVLAYHYEQSDDLAKKREYLRRAGEAAAARYANTAAINYLSRALELAPPDDLSERYALLLAREQVYALQAARNAQRADLDALATLADLRDDPATRAEVALRHARYAYSMSDFVVAARAAQHAATLAQTANIPQMEATALQRMGSALYSQRDYAAAHMNLERSLALAEAVGDTYQICATLNTLSSVAADEGRYTVARAYLERSSRIARATGNRRAEGYALNDLGGIAAQQGHLTTAVVALTECLAVARLIGDRWFEGRVLGNLGSAQLMLGNYPDARTYYAQSLALTEVTGDRLQMAYTYENLGLAALGQGDSASAGAYVLQSLALAESLGDRFLAGLAQRGRGNVALVHGDLAAAAHAFQESAIILREVGSPAMVAEALAGLAQVALAQGDAPGALASVEEILAHLESETLDGAEEPMVVYLTCYQALCANADSRAPALLARARAELLARAAQITDPAARQCFLEVAAHRGLLADSR
jgi:adenylate cyclase